MQAKTTYSISIKVDMDEVTAATAPSGSNYIETHRLFKDFGLPKMPLPEFASKV